MQAKFLSCYALRFRKKPKTAGDFPSNNIRGSSCRNNHICCGPIFRHPLEKKGFHGLISVRPLEKGANGIVFQPFA